MLSTESPFFKNLTADEYGLLSRLLEPLGVPARTAIVRQGEAAQYVYLIVEGHVTLRYKPYDGPRITLTHLRKGEIFGWSAVVGNLFYTSDAVSTTPVETLRVEGAALRAACVSHPAAGSGILHKLAAAVSPRWLDSRNQIESLLRDLVLPGT
jgi:CRP/FNR family cyclic AMP-dependent transcriptional regulator